MINKNKLPEEDIQDETFNGSVPDSLIKSKLNQTKNQSSKELPNFTQ
jgi:hypothetical protein